MLSKSLSTSEKFAALVTSVPAIFEFCHALYPLLVSHTDDFGRLPGDPFTVKLSCYPISPRPLEDFAAALQAMHDVELLVWYALKTKQYIQIGAFESHQQGLHKRTKSAFPRPPGDSGNFPESPGQEKRTEENLTEENRSTDDLSALRAGFDLFWKTYPKKVGKDAACRVWLRRRPDAALIKTILAAVIVQSRSEQWRRDGGQYIPHPTTWLTQGRWQDELRPATSADVRCPHHPPCTSTSACYRRRDVETAVHEGRITQAAADRHLATFEPELARKPA